MDNSNNVNVDDSTRGKNKSTPTLSLSPEHFSIYLLFLVDVWFTSLFISVHSIAHFRCICLRITNGWMENHLHRNLVTYLRCLSKQRNAKPVQRLESRAKSICADGKSFLLAKTTTSKTIAPRKLKERQRRTHTHRGSCKKKVVTANKRANYLWMMIASSEQWAVSSRPWESNG